MAGSAELTTVAWVDAPPTTVADGFDALAQCSAHGAAVPACVRADGDGLTVTFATPQRRVAPGQTVALYDPGRPESVVGSGVVR